MAGKLEKRLAKIEQALTEKAHQKMIANCNCRDERKIFVPDKEGIEASFEAELKLICPVHAERRLGKLIWGAIIGSNGQRIPNPKMDPLVEEYRRRLSRQLERMREDDAEDL